MAKSIELTGLLIVVTILSISACLPVGSSGDKAQALPSDTDTPLTSERADPTPTISPSPTNVSAGEAQEALRLAEADLAARLNVPSNDIEVVRVEAVEWSDTSLGCPQPGMVYAQVITPGFRLVLEAEGQKYEYHTDGERTVVLCEAAPSFETPSKDDDASVEDGWPNQPIGDDVVVETPVKRR